MIRARTLWAGLAPVGGLCLAPACGQSPPLMYQGHLGVTAATAAGVGPPAGALWSELPTWSNSVQGFLADSESGARLADDFTVADAPGWGVTDIEVYAYQPGSKASDQPFRAAAVRIWRGPPEAPGSQVVAEFSGPAPAAEFTGLYRADSRGLPDRPLFSLRIPMRVDLPPGRYWVEWSLSGRYGSGVWTPPATMAGTPAMTGGDGLRFLGGAWGAAAESLNGGAPTPHGLPLVVVGFVIGSNPACYPDCDGGTLPLPPTLGHSDFTCFVQRFASGSPYANCDWSTEAPVLTVSDFTCFLQAIAAGCAP